VIFDESELREADVKWEEGCDRAEPERLGGPPPYPGGKCLARIQIRAPDYLAAANEEDDENDDKYVPLPEAWTTKCVYSVGRESTSRVREYYLAWAKRIGQDPNVNYGDRTLWMKVMAGRRTRVIRIRGMKDRTVRDVYLEYKETQPRGVECGAVGS
jgi:hypothetical protein